MKKVIHMKRKSFHKNIHNPGIHLVNPSSTELQYYMSKQGNEIIFVYN